MATVYRMAAIPAPGGRQKGGYFLLRLHCNGILGEFCTKNPRCDARFAAPLVIYTDGVTDVWDLRSGKV